MALSDALARLSAETLKLEESVDALRKDRQAEAQRRAKELRGEIDESREALRTKLDSASNTVETQWNRLQSDLAESVQRGHENAAARRARRKADRAADDAYWAEIEAEDALDYATYALQEAERAILDAAAAQEAADAVSSS